MALKHRWGAEILAFADLFTLFN